MKKVTKHLIILFLSYQVARIATAALGFVPGGFPAIAVNVALFMWSAEFFNVVLYWSTASEYKVVSINELSPEEMLIFEEKVREIVRSKDERP